MPISVNEPTSIVPGVFFTPPEVLPRGRHSLSREQVEATQRERLLTATTELLAANGYRGFGAADVVKRAGVSLAAFYDWFANKDEAVFAGYDRFIGVVVQRLVAAFEVSAGPPAELVHDVLGAYLAALQEDLVVARAYQVEIDALGPPARQRRRDSLTALAGLIRDRTEERDPAVVLPWSAYVGVVYAARQLASDALDTAPEPDLHGLGTDLEAWIRDLFRQR